MCKCVLLNPGKFLTVCDVHWSSMCTLLKWLDINWGGCHLFVYLGLFPSLIGWHPTRTLSKFFIGKIFLFAAPNLWSTTPGQAWFCWSGIWDNPETAPSYPTCPWTAMSKHWSVCSWKGKYLSSGQDQTQIVQCWFLEIWNPLNLCRFCTVH